MRFINITIIVFITLYFYSLANPLYPFTISWKEGAPDFSSLHTITLMDTEGKGHYDYYVHVKDGSPINEGDILISFLCNGEAGDSMYVNKIDTTDCINKEIKRELHCKCANGSRRYIITEPCPLDSLIIQELTSAQEEQTGNNNERIFSKYNIDIYPNPATGELILNFTNSSFVSEFLFIELYNSEVKFIDTIFNGNITDDGLKYRLLKDTYRGMYLIIIKNNERNILYTQKVIIN